MPQVNTESLLEAIAPDTPCGADLSYDPAYMELERVSQGAPQDRIVGPDGPAEGPDWRIVEKQAVALLGRTKDLRVAILLAKALLHTGGFAGFREGTRVVRELLERYWDTLHPQMLEEDDFSPIMRSNALRDLCDRISVLNPLRTTSLVNLPALGSYSYRDIGIATGEFPPLNGVPAPEKSKIETAFDNCALEPLEATAAAVAGALEDLTAIEGYIAEKVGAAESVSLDDVTGLLRPILRILSDRMARRSSAVAAAGGGGNGMNYESATEGEPGPMSTVQSAHGVSHAAGASQGRPFVAGEINSRSEVIRALDAVCGYYERHEPSSPVPILLRRAQRLVPMNFIEIMRDLAPSGVPEIDKIRGTEEGQN
ncbi:MAG TPA: type VI secretion system protein TssA [Polyangiales bacterium]|nr:type VI secretion system protein TssA [Polyangiales bacterium]